jgi:hypothetical protein
VPAAPIHREEMYAPLGPTIVAFCVHHRIGWSLGSPFGLPAHNRRRVWHTRRRSRRQEYQITHMGHRRAGALSVRAARHTSLSPATSAHDSARPCHICTGTGLVPTTSVPGQGSPLPQAPGLGSLLTEHTLPRRASRHGLRLCFAAHATGADWTVGAHRLSTRSADEACRPPFKPRRPPAPFGTLAGR